MRTAAKITAAGICALSIPALSLAWNVAERALPHLIRASELLGEWAQPSDLGDTDLQETR